jgi:hypothetical protein
MPFEQLPTEIPYLDYDGTNWAIFSMHFRKAMQATHRWGHFDGTRPRPSAKDPSAPIDAEREAQKCWEHEDIVTRYLLSERLPDSTALCLRRYQTAQACWTRLDNMYLDKSMNDLEQAFLEMRCPKGADVRTFLTNVRQKGEELTAAGIEITDKDYQRTVLFSIPEELADFASLHLSVAKLTHAVVNVDTLIDLICEEAQRLEDCRRDGRRK